MKCPHCRYRRNTYKSVITTSPVEGKLVARIRVGNKLGDLRVLAAIDGTVSRALDRCNVVNGSNRAWKVGDVRDISPVDLAGDGYLPEIAVRGDVRKSREKRGILDPPASVYL